MCVCVSLVPRPARAINAHNARGQHSTETSREKPRAKHVSTLTLGRQTRGSPIPVRGSANPGMVRWPSHCCRAHAVRGRGLVPPKMLAKAAGPADCRLPAPLPWLTAAAWSQRGRTDALLYARVCTHPSARSRRELGAGLLIRAPATHRLVPRGSEALSEAFECPHLCSEGTAVPVSWLCPVQRCPDGHSGRPVPPCLPLLHTRLPRLWTAGCRLPLPGYVLLFQGL